MEASRRKRREVQVMPVSMCIGNEHFQINLQRKDTEARVTVTDSVERGIKTFSIAPQTGVALAMRVTESTDNDKNR